MTLYLKIQPELTSLFLTISSRMRSELLCYHMLEWAGSSARRQKLAGTKYQAPGRDCRRRQGVLQLFPGELGPSAA
jgi:hypothetical protein